MYVAACSSVQPRLWAIWTIMPAVSSCKRSLITSALQLAPQVFDLHDDLGRRVIPFPSLLLLQQLQSALLGCDDGVGRRWRLWLGLRRRLTWGDRRHRVTGRRCVLWQIR